MALRIAPVPLSGPGVPGIWRVDPERVDVHRFQRLIGEARATASEPARITLRAASRLALDQAGAGMSLAERALVVARARGFRLLEGAVLSVSIVTVTSGDRGTRITDILVA